ncbi:MAG TPA: hypothetical protein VFU21_18585 [Kofleriaceae bacterium]|nr:hypothetical protein [Kofleriaceae bacterium]
MRYLLASLALAAAAGCGDDSPADGPPVTGRCLGASDDGGDESPAGMFDDPDDFDRSACSDAIPLDSIDTCGVWHLDLDFEDFGTAAGAIRVDLSDGGDLEGLVFGRETEDVRLTSTDLFLRHVEVDEEGNEIATRTFDACEAREDGTLAGTYVRCNPDGECGTASFVAYKVEPLDEPPAEGVTLISEWNGGDSTWSDESVTYNLRHRGDLVYVIRGSDGLHIVDLADPAAPRDLGHLPALYPEVGEYYNDVKLAEREDGSLFALAASNIRGVVVIDVSDPQAPEEVVDFPEAPPEADDPTVNVHSIFVEGQRVYFTVFGGIEIWDIADPAAPVRLGGYWLPDLDTLGGFVHDLYVEGGVAYLDYWNRGLVVVDASVDPAAPSLVGVFDAYERRTSHSSWVTTAGGRRVAIHGDEDFDAHLRVIDVDPDSATAFEEIGSYQTRPEVSIHNVMAVGEEALVTYYQDGLRVLDLSDPTEPVETAHFQTWPGPEPGYGRMFYEGALGVDYDPERDLVLLADTHRGLLVLSLDR